MARKSTKLRPIMTRIPEGLRHRLEREAALNRRSMNGEVIHRLEESFRRTERLNDVFGGAHNVALFRQLAGAIGLVEVREGKSWTMDFMAAREVLVAFFDVLKREMPGLKTITFETKDETGLPSWHTVGNEIPIVIAQDKP